MQEYGKTWSKVKSKVSGRSVGQVRAHAQKFFLKVDAIRPPNIDVTSFLNTQSAEFFAKLKTPPKKGKGRESSNSVNLPEERVILVSDLQGNPVNGPPRKKKETNEAEVQTAFELPSSMLNPREQCGVILQTCISNRDLDPAFMRREKRHHEMHPIQPEELKHEPLKYPSDNFFQQMSDVPGLEGISLQLKNTGTQTKLTFATKVTTEVQTELYLQVPLACSVITEKLKKMRKAIDQLILSYSHDLLTEPEKSPDEQFLLKSADRLRAVIAEAIVAQQRSVAEIGLLKP